MSKAKGFLFAAEEDFGIVVVEAQAAGTPVIAFGRGGALETVTAGQTGLFYDKQDVPSLIAAVQEFEKKEFNPSQIRAHAKKFNRQRFVNEFTQFVEQKKEQFNEMCHSCRR